MNRQTTTRTAGAAAPSRDGIDRDALVTEHLKLVTHVVRGLQARYPRHVDRQELWNAGAYGLVDASRRYDETMGIPFARYAMIRIRGAIIDSTRSRDWATRAVRRGMRDVHAATETFQQDHHREPTADELADLIGVTVAELGELRGAATAAQLLHLDVRVGGDSSDPDTTLVDLVTEDDTDYLPAAMAEQTELSGTVRHAVDHLPEPLREVTIRYYFNGEYLHDIADDLGVTEARVSQIRAQGIAALRTYLSGQYDGVPDVDDNVPGRRARAAFLATMEHSDWASQYGAARPALAISA